MSIKVPSIDLRASPQVKRSMSHAGVKHHVSLADITRPQQMASSCGGALLGECINESLLLSEFGAVYWAG